MNAANQYDEFEVDGISFRLKPLPVLVAEVLAPPLTEMVTPAVAAFIAGDRNIEQLNQALRGLASAVAQVPKFREAFCGQCQVTIGKAEGQVVWTELRGQVFEDTFRRKHHRYYEWIANCIRLEFGAFLAEIGRDLVAALKGSPSNFLSGFPGAFGGSPQTPESKTVSET
jgi:hypothetical protein